MTERLTCLFFYSSTYKEPEVLFGWETNLRFKHNPRPNPQTPAFDHLSIPNKHVRHYRGNEKGRQLYGNGLCRCLVFSERFTRSHHPGASSFDCHGFRWRCRSRGRFVFEKNNLPWNSFDFALLQCTDLSGYLLYSNLSDLQTVANTTDYTVSEVSDNTLNYYAKVEFRKGLGTLYAVVRCLTSFYVMHLPTYILVTSSSRAIRYVGVMCQFRWHWNYCLVHCRTRMLTTYSRMVGQGQAISSGRSLISVTAMQLWKRALVGM